MPLLSNASSRVGSLRGYNSARLISLPSETASLSKTGLASSWCAENGAAVGTGHDSLAMTEDGGDVETSLALDIHEVAIG